MFKKGVAGVFTLLFFWHHGLIAQSKVNVTVLSSLMAFLKTPLTACIKIIMALCGSVHRMA